MEDLFDLSWRENLIEIPISEEIKQKAEEKAKEDILNAQNNGLTSRFNTNELENKTIGNIGELIFADWLDSQGVKYQTNEVTGQGDTFDFKIKIDKKDKTIDVKTGKYSSYPLKWDFTSCFRITERQINEHPSDFYFFIAIYELNAYLCGFVADVVLRGYPVKRHPTLGFANYVCYARKLARPQGIIRLING
jgi:hypothetical protein